MPKPVQVIWSVDAERFIRQLISETQATTHNAHATRLNALYIGTSLWAAYYLHPSGNVIIVDEELINQPELDVIDTDENSRTRIIVWGAERYPDLIQLLPQKPMDAVPCSCGELPPFPAFKLTCTQCNALGWVLPD